MRLVQVGIIESADRHHAYRLIWHGETLREVGINETSAVTDDNIINIVGLYRL